MLMRVYARCVVGIEDVWITRMDATRRPAQQERSRREAPGDDRPGRPPVAEVDGSRRTVAEGGGASTPTGIG
jgi:hypothetical protein